MGVAASSQDDLQSGHSSPGNLHFEHVLSYGFRQMPQTSSSGISHRQAATARQVLILTFIVIFHEQSWLRRVRENSGRPGERVNRRVSPLRSGSIRTFLISRPAVGRRRHIQMLLRLIFQQNNTAPFSPSSDPRFIELLKSS